MQLKDFLFYLPLITFFISLAINLYQLHDQQKKKRIIGTSFNHTWHQLISMKESIELFWKNHKSREVNIALSAAKQCLDGIFTNSSRLADSIEKDSKILKLGHPGDRD